MTAPSRDSGRSLLTARIGWALSSSLEERIDQVRPSRSPNPAGRPRDADRTAELLHAALELVDELGYRQLTVERLVARTGVAKTTIYRRWPNLSALVMDAFMADVETLVPFDFSLEVRETFRATIRALVRSYQGRDGRILAALLGQAQSDEVLRAAMLQRWLEPRRRLGVEAVQRAQSQKLLRSDVSPEVVIDALYGPVFYRLLLPYAPLSEAYVDEIIEQVFAGIKLPKEQP